MFKAMSLRLGGELMEKKSRALENRTLETSCQKDDDPHRRPADLIRLDG
jgi:hypothetical protein